MDSGSLPACGTLLRRYRRSAGLTQEELAELAGISVRSIRDLECGKLHAPRRDTIHYLATALELSEREFAGFKVAARQLGNSPLSTFRAETSQEASLGYGLARTPFVGRERELELLDGHLLGDGPPFLLLAGEPGMGKTRLLRTAIPRAVRAGWRVLEGDCLPLGEREAYAPLRVALQHHIRGQRLAQLRVDLKGCAWLVRLLPELADSPIPTLPTWTLTPAQERRLMAEAVIRFLTNVAGPSGTLLVLDDLQWASPDALDLLTVLLRTASDIPLRVIGAYRDTDVHRHEPFFTLLSDMAISELVVHRALSPLAPQEAARLLDILLEGTDVQVGTRREEVLQRAEGVPFFLVTCAQELLLEKSSEEVPWNIVQSVRRRVAALPPAAEEILRIAALVGRTIPRALLISVSAQSDEEVLASLDATCQARLLEETGEDAYQFVHDVIREVVEGDLGAARRKVLHRRVAEVWEQKSGESPVEQLAYHYARSDAAGTAVPYLEQAGDRAEAQYAHVSAARYYRELVDLLDLLGRTEGTARACEKMGVEVYLTGRYDIALPVLERAVEAYHLLDDLEGQRRTLAQIGWLHAVRGTSQEGIARIEAAIETLEMDTPSPGLVALYVARGRMYGLTGRYGECFNAVERAVEIARVTGDGRSLAAAEAQLSDLLVVLGRFDEALQAAEEAACLAEKADDLPALCMACGAMLGAYAKKGDCARAQMTADRMVEVAKQFGDPAVIAFAHTERCMTATWTGKWTQARADIETALCLGREIGPSDATGFALLRYGVLCLYEGDWEGAAQHLEESVAIAEQCNNLGHIPWIQTWLAELDLLMGNPDNARGRLMPFLHHDRSRPETVWVIGARQLLAWAYLDLGDLTRAKEMVAYCLADARGTGDRFALLKTLQVQAMLAVREACWTTAVQALEEGLFVARGMPYPYQEARLLQEYGRMHASKGEPERARERLEQALAIFSRLGAKKDVEGTNLDLNQLDRCYYRRSSTSLPGATHV